MVVVVEMLGAVITFIHSSNDDPQKLRILKLWHQYVMNDAIDAAQLGIWKILLIRNVSLASAYITASTANSTLVL